MRNTEKVIVKIPKGGGGVTIEVDGVKGEQCSLITKDLERRLGQVVSDTPTEEMYERPVDAQVENYQ